MNARWISPTADLGSVRFGAVCWLRPSSRPYNSSRDRRPASSLRNVSVVVDRGVWMRRRRSGRWSSWCRAGGRWPWHRAISDMGAGRDRLLSSRQPKAQAHGAATTAIPATVGSIGRRRTNSRCGILRYGQTLNSPLKEPGQCSVARLSALVERGERIMLDAPGTTVALRCLPDTPTTEPARLRALAQLRHFHREQDIQGQGERSDTWYRVVSGSARKHAYARF
jgi:hypothetical protein